MTAQSFRFWLLALALWCCARVLAAATPEARPNIVLIVVDDLGAMDTGFTGSRFYETPNLDRVAREGMMFRQAYACGPNCAPTRAALLSGQYAPRTGIYTVGTSERGSAKDRRLVPIPNRSEMDGKVVTWAELLREVGYTTAMIGKWHLGGKPGTLPTAQGFAVNIAGSEAGHPPSYFAPYRLDHLVDGPQGEHLTDRLGQEAVAFITAQAGNPFCLYLPLYAVHTPIQAKPDLAARFKGREPEGERSDPAYAGLLYGADQTVGRVLDVLDELGLAENTVVMVTSDNGGAQGITGNAPLRGYKGMLYEGGIRVPLAMRWPAGIPAGSVSDEPVITVDFYPTFLALAGTTPVQDSPLDGVSLLPVMQGQGRLDRDAMFWHFPCYLEAKGGGSSAKQAKTDRLQSDPFRTRPAGAIRMDGWKLIEHFEDGRVELYRLSEDPGESRDLAATEPERREALLAKLRDWRLQVEAPVPSQPNPDFRPQE